MVERLGRYMKDYALPLPVDDFVLKSHYSASSNVVASGIVRGVPRGHRCWSRRVRVGVASHHFNCIFTPQNGPNSRVFMLGCIFG